jgi:hypothetical protein
LTQFVNVLSARQDSNAARLSRSLAVMLQRKSDDVLAGSTVVVGSLLVGTVWSWLALRDADLQIREEGVAVIEPGVFDGIEAELLASPGPRS